MDRRIGFHKEAIMRLLVLLFFLILPVASFAQYVGDLSPPGHPLGAR
jgi:hypothetical protein